MPEEESVNDWDAALAHLLEEEAAYDKAAQLYKDWSSSPYGEFTKLDAMGTVGIAVVAYLSGYPNVRAFTEDMDTNAIAWLVELLDSAVLQGILVGLGADQPKDGSDAIYMSPEIIQFLEGEGYESRFDPPKDHNPHAEEEED